MSWAKSTRTGCFSLVLLAVLILSGTARASDIVRICDDDAEWPPYAYFGKTDGKKDKSVIEGATVELAAEIFKQIGLPYTYDMIPWKRCLFEVANFAKNQKYEVVVNASFNTERAGNYYVSAPIYATRFGIAYNRKKFPKGPDIKQLSKLKDHLLCGPTGYNFKMYDLEYDQVDTHNKHYQQILKRVGLDRCDIGLVGVEIVLGLSRIEGWSIPENVIMEPLPQIKPTTFHIWVSKQSPRAHALAVAINQAIIILQHDGRSDRIFKKYLTPPAATE